MRPTPTTPSPSRSDLFPAEVRTIAGVYLTRGRFDRTVQSSAQSTPSRRKQQWWTPTDVSHWCVIALISSTSFQFRLQRFGLRPLITNLWQSNDSRGGWGGGRSRLTCFWQVLLWCLCMLSIRALIHLPSPWGTQVLKKATIRKEQEPDFEEKRFNVTIGEDEREFDKENDFFRERNYRIIRE